jgi:hypothetical protein
MKISKLRLTADGFSTAEIAQIEAYCDAAQQAGRFNFAVVTVRPKDAEYLCCVSHGEILGQLRPGCVLGDPGAQQVHGQECPCCGPNAQRGPSDPAIQKQWSTFEQKLLGIGGTRVVWRGAEDSLTELLSGGRLFNLPVELLGMPLQICHANAAFLWSEDITGTRLVSGYGLYPDGLWRQHSWCVKCGVLLETNVPMSQYFGIELSKKASAESWFGNFLAARFPALGEAAFKYAKRHYPQVMALLHKYAKQEKRRRRNSFRDLFGKS